MGIQRTIELAPKENAQRALNGRSVGFQPHERTLNLASRPSGPEATLTGGLFIARKKKQQKEETTPTSFATANTVPQSHSFTAAKGHF